PLLRVCFSRHRPPRPLPSFPTRRSSDLLPPRRDDAVEGRALQVRRGRRDQQIERDPLPVSARRLVPARGGHPSRPLHGHPLGRSDRKSTRLNSSHQIISYAVFCLKKKII